MAGEGVDMNSYYHLIRYDGNKDLFCALEMSIAAQTNNVPFHIHVEGLRGTGKTTIIRAAKQILPPIARIKNCIYNCHPDAPHCPEHRNLSQKQVQAIGSEIVPCPFLEISHAAKVGTVIGSIDIGKLTDRNNSIAALLPGTIPQAHRGIIFIDEINRLADTSPELADVLLDVMGTKPGRVQIEETGLPTVDFPVSVSIWAASNPDEEPGSLVQIRKQLADRFDVMVSMGRPNNHQAVYDILNHGAGNFSSRHELDQLLVGELEAIQIDSTIRKILAAIYIEFGLESLRAVKALESAASLTTLLSGRRTITIADIIRVVPLALGHRTDVGTITNIIRYLKNLHDGFEDKRDNVINSNISEALKVDIKNKENKSWLMMWWDYLRKKLSVRCNNASGKSTSAKGGLQMSSVAKAIDPVGETMIAPAKRALPLGQLPDEQLITVEVKK